MKNSFFSDLDESFPQENTSSFFSDLPKEDTSLKGQFERKLGGPAIEFATKAFTSIPNFMDAIQNLGVKGMNELIKKTGVKGLGLSDEELDKFIKVTKQLGPTAGIPAASEIIENIHKATGGKFKAQTPGEEILQKGAGIVGEIAGFGPEAVLGTPLKAAGTIALGGTTAALEESGTNPWVALGGGILADILTRSAGGLIKKLGGIFKKGVATTAGEATAKLAHVKPEQIKQGVIEAGERLGIKPEEIPLSAQIDNPVIQGIESKVRSSSLSGKALESQLEKTGQKLVGTYENIGKELSSRQELLPSAISQESVNALKRIEEKAEEAYRSMYAQAAKALPKDAKIPERFVSPINKVIDSTLKKLKSDLGTPAKDTLFNRLSRLKKSWEGITPSVEQIQEAKRDLNQVIKYEVKGGVDKLLEPLAGVLRNALKSYGTINVPYGFRFQEAERLFADNAKTFRKNPMVRSLVKGEAPEQIISKLGTVKGIRDLGKILKQSPEGKDAFDALKKYKLEQLIGSKLLNKKGQISWGNATGMLKNAKNRDLVLELIGPQNYKKLQDVIKVSSGIEEGLRKFLNTSQTATSHFDIALLVGAPIKAIGYLFSGRPLKAAATASSIFTPKVLANLIANPNFVESVKKTAIAGRGSNMERFLAEAKRTAQIVMGELDLVTEEQPEKIGKQ